MASHYWGIDLGTGSAFGVVSTGTSTTSKAFEVRIDDAANANRGEAMAYIERLMRYIVKEDQSSPLKS